MAKILVVDDNASNRKLAFTVLEHAGHTVFQASDAEEGIAVAHGERPDVILMDIQMPGMDGLTAARILKEGQSTKDIKVIALTACAMRGDRERMLAGGCDGYISKPIQYKTFMHEVNKVLGGGEIPQE